MYSLDMKKPLTPEEIIKRVLEEMIKRDTLLIRAGKKIPKYSQDDSDNSND